MTATNQTYLPTYEELYVEPLNITSAALKAGAPYFGLFCDRQSKVSFNNFLVIYYQLNLLISRSLCYARARRKTRESVYSMEKT